MKKDFGLKGSSSKMNKHKTKPDLQLSLEEELNRFFKINAKRHIAQAKFDAKPKHYSIPNRLIKLAATLSAFVGIGLLRFGYAPVAATQGISYVAGGLLQIGAALTGFKYAFADKFRVANLQKLNFKTELARQYTFTSLGRTNVESFLNALIKLNSTALIRLKFDNNLTNRQKKKVVIAFQNIDDALVHMAGLHISKEIDLEKLLSFQKKMETLAHESISHNIIEIADNSRSIIRSIAKIRIGQVGEPSDKEVPLAADTLESTSIEPPDLTVQANTPGSAQVEEITHDKPSNFGHGL